MPDTPREPPLRIVLDTGRYVVADKPAGLLSVPGIGPDKADCVRSRVAAMYPHASGPMTVHRLDQDTSGLIVVGLDADAQRAMSQVFEHRRVTKRYIAVVQGHLASHAGLIDLPLRIDWPNRPRHIVAQDGRPSQTRYRVLGPVGPDTRVEFTPITGRGHQLRVHAADPRGLGAPILGDPLYGDPTKAPRLLLHAWSLEFADPFTGQLRHVTSEPGF